MGANTDNLDQTSPLVLLDGEVRIWIDQAVIQMQVSDLKHRAPVELLTKDARKIAEALLAMSDRLDAAGE